MCSHINIINSPLTAHFMSLLIIHTSILISKKLCFDPILVHSEKMIKKKPKFGALPTLNMPKRSRDTTKPKARRALSVVNDNTSTEEPRKKCYSSFSELCKRIKALKTLNERTVKFLEDRLVLQKRSNLMLPELEIMIDDSLGFTISVYGWFLPEDHEIYTDQVSPHDYPLLFISCYKIASML